MKQWHGLSIGLILTLASVPATAGKSRDAGAKLLDALVQCQEISDAAQRLACFDSRVGALKTARQDDKKLFAVDDRPAKFSPITATVTGASEIQDGVWLVVLSDHSVWRTEEAIRFEPVRGNAVHIVQGALGSYLANIDSQRAVRVRPMR